MKKRLLTCVLAVFVVLAALPMSMFVSAETTSTIICACDTLTGWTKLNGDKTFVLTDNRAQAQSDDGAIGTNVGYGFLQAYYEFPSPVDVSDYTAIEWDVGYTGSNGINEVLTAYATVGYMRIFSNGNSPTNNQSNSLVFRFDSLEVTSINATWAHLKATFENATVKRNFDPTALTAFRFYTSENTYDSSVANGAMRLDNIMVTGKEATVEPQPAVETVDAVVTNCDTLTGWTKLNGDQTFVLTTVRAQAQSDDGAVGTNVGNGFLKAYYTLPAPMDITGYKYIEWDSCFTNNMWPSIASTYSSQLYLRLFSDGNDPTNNQSNSLIFNFSKLEVTTIDANWVHIKAPLDSPSINRNFNPQAFTAFRFYTNENTNDTSVPSGAIRFDNIKVTGKEVAVEPSTEPGDANGDKAVDTRDYTRVKKYLMDNTVEINALADLSGDNVIQVDDMIRLRFLILGEQYVAQTPEQPVEDLLINACETKDNWTYSGNAASFGTNGAGVTDGCLHVGGGRGALRPLEYTPATALDLSAYKALEWDMMVINGSSGADNFADVAAAYADTFSVELSDGTTTKQIKVSSWQVGEPTSTTGAGRFRHIAASLENTGLDLTNITSIKFYTARSTDPLAPTDFPETFFRFDNIKATSNVVASTPEPVEDLLINACETKDNWTYSGNAASFAINGAGVTDSCLHVGGGRGALRPLEYVPATALDLSAYKALEWDMMVVNSSTGADNFADVAAAYADTFSVELSDGTTTKQIKVSSWQVGEPTSTSGAGRFRHIAVSLENTGLDLTNITSIKFYTARSTDPLAPTDFPETIFRLDNIKATSNDVTPNQGGGSTPALNPLTINDCETNTGWSYELGGTVLTGSNMGIDGNYVAMGANKGALRKLTYTASTPVDISGYTTLQWDMVLKSSSAGSDYFYAAAEAYEDYVGVTVTDGSGNSADLGIDSWQIGAISGDWRTMSASLVGKGLDLSAIASVSFYTLPAGTGSINDNLDNIVVRLDNIKATTDSVTPNWNEPGTTEEEAAFMPKIFSDGMLFQQNKPMNVWGKTDAGNVVDVELLDGTTRVSLSAVTADSDGNWSVALPSREGGNTAYTLKVSENGVLKKTVNDVLIGELWVSSGQSNMEFFLGNTVSVADRATIKSNQYIRIFKEPSVPTADGADGVLSSTPVYDIVDDVNNSNSVGHGTWVNGTANYSDLCYVSAIAYKTAVELQAQLGVPVGIINTARGSSVIESWLSRESIDNNETIKSKLQSRGAYYTEKALAVSKNWQFMTTLYNTKLAPIAGMAPDNTKLSAHSGMNIAGVMWYQGESNIKYAEASGKNTYYTAALNQLIDDWSVIFGFEKGKMPFIFAHIAPCDYSSVRSADYDSAVAQLAAAMNESWAAHKNTAIQIPIYDLPLDYTLPAGYANQCIHPWQKQPVADRFAATMLGKFYGGNTGYDAPVYKSATVSGNTIRITMDNIGTGLKAGDGNTKLFGFTICGDDHKFVNAEATLSGNTIIVSSPFVANPVAAAYGFNTFNTNANLYNSYDLPAVPFYTAEFDDAVYLGDHDDWMSCDYTEVWRDNGIVTGDYVDTWKASNTTGSTVTFDTANKNSGNSAIKVVTTSASRGAAPVLKPSGVTAYRQHFGDYKYLSVYVKNGGASAITLRLQIGSACYATVAGGSGSAVTVAAGSGFTKYTFDISNLVNISNGNAATATQISNAFSQNAISFIAEESGSTFYLDDICLGS